MKRCLISFFVALMVCLTAGCHNTLSGGMMGFAHSDASLTADVQHALEASAQFPDSPVTVESNNGTVRLSGYVKTIRQSDLAAALAQKIEGVKTVDNQLIVRK